MSAIEGDRPWEAAQDPLAAVERRVRAAATYAREQVVTNRSRTASADLRSARRTFPRCASLRHPAERPDYSVPVLVEVHADLDQQGTPDANTAVLVVRVLLRERHPEPTELARTALAVDLVDLRPDDLLRALDAGARGLGAAVETQVRDVLAAAVLDGWEVSP